MLKYYMILICICLIFLLFTDVVVVVVVVVLCLVTSILLSVAEFTNKHSLSGSGLGQPVYIGHCQITI